ncbi:MAG: histidine--tRNA ligase [Chloroflexi bacterium]|nr:histidine--tRNA ligase [Chloroflexota bacterium]
MFRRPTGTEDRLPDQQAVWRFIVKAAETTAARFGYGRLDTPTFEETALFVRGVGEGTDLIEQETYTFEDRGGTRLTLRSEGTAPAMRAYLQSGLQSAPIPVRLYYVTPIFRYDRPQRGRLREHHQFGVEAIGESDAAMDVETIQLLSCFYHAAGLSSVNLQLNSIGDERCRPAFIEILRHYYSSRLDQVCANCQVRYVKNPLRLLDCKEDRCQPVIAAAPKPLEHLCAGCREHFERVQYLLRLLRITFTLNDRLVRGLGYYTRTVFEFYGAREGAQAALGGGGRYNRLVEELGGKPTPAVGFGCGLERVVLALQEEHVPRPEDPGIDISICHLGREAEDWALIVASTLRQQGFRVVTTPGERRIAVQLKQADHYRARFAGIIGSEEAASRTVSLRDMKTKEEKHGLTVESIIARLSTEARDSH